MPWVSTIKPIILEKAILLFGERGYDGLTTRDLAKAAGVGEPNIGRLFESKENLYQVALTTVTERARDELGKVLVSIYAEQKNQNVRYFVTEAARRWYQSIPQASARFLQQVMIADKKQHEKARAAIGQIISTVAAALQEKAKGKSAAHAKESAETLILALFQYKVSLPHTVVAKEEREKVDLIIKNWLEKVLGER
jgi:AcrR family transcriptional regulator